MLAIPYEGLVLAFDDSSPIVVPPAATKAFTRWLNEEFGALPSEVQDQPPNELDDNLIGFVFETAKKYDGKVIPKDIGDFIVEYTLSGGPFDHFTPIEKRTSLDFDVFRLEVVVFGWAGDGTDNDPLQMFVYKSDNNLLPNKVPSIPLPAAPSTQHTSTTL